MPDRRGGSESGADLSRYRAELDDAYTDSELFVELYEQLAGHGFDLIPYDEAQRTSRDLRRSFDAPLEYLIDQLVAPRGFWGHTIGTPLDQ